MILSMIDRSLAKNDFPISLIETGVLRTAPLVFSTMTGIAIMHTTSTLDVRPMPYARTKRGMSVARGAACITINIGEKSQSKNSFSPTQRPMAMPRTAESLVQNDLMFFKLLRDSV